MRWGTCSLSSVSCLSCAISHSLVSAPLTPVVGFGGVALLEPRRTGPLAVEATLGGTADRALSACLETVGGGREGEDDDVRLGFWGGVLVAVVAMIHGKGWVCWYRSDRLDSRLKEDPGRGDMG